MKLTRLEREIDKDKRRGKENIDKTENASIQKFIERRIKEEIEDELVSALETNILVKTAEVSVTDIEENDVSRQTT